MSLEKKYDNTEIEDKWAKTWVEEKTYEWTENKNPEKNYLIDSPPPYPYSKLHGGNFFNYTYQDFVARIKRMQGYSVLQPQGWDCHGLPAELHVEKVLGKKAEEIGIKKFKEECKKVLIENIENVINQMKKAGLSIDWSKQYTTMTDDYKKLVQTSFLEMQEKGFIHKSEHPVSWCVSCHSSIAEAQTDKKERIGKLHYIKLPLLNGEKISIATTRPEYMGSCVAVYVHPNDERYKRFIGEKIKLPFFEREVEIIANEESKPDFGTGVVYNCTFGGKEDYLWIIKNKLPIIKTLEEDGKFNEKAKFLNKLTVKEAREKIIEELKKIGLYEKFEETKQAINVCERCKNPLEIIAKKQWFFSTTKLKKQILETQENMKWYPTFMKTRLNDWVNNIAWDWVISRQRYWATPFPVWNCENCDLLIYAKKNELPIDPTIIEKNCSKCGKKLIGETDVMDTWMDSSISPLRVSKWMKNERKFLTNLRTQGEDIIKTWLFYTIARIKAYGKEPFKESLINGLVLGLDGKKMSKRNQKGIILPEELFEKYGVDAYRQWVGKSLPGQDWPVNPQEFEFAKKFLNKLYNVSKFSQNFINEEKPETKNISDKYILNELEKTKKIYFNELKSYNFGNSLECVRKFTRQEFADYYIELSKYRLYELNDETAKKVLTKVLKETLLLLAPFIPFITEEIYQKLFKPKKSIHLELLPEVKKVSESITEKSGNLKNAIDSMRLLKNEAGIGLGKEIKTAEVPEKLSLEIINELKTVMKIKEIKKGVNYKIIET